MTMTQFLFRAVSGINQTNFEQYREVMLPSEERYLQAIVKYQIPEAAQAMCENLGVYCDFQRGQTYIMYLVQGGPFWRRFFKLGAAVLPEFQGDITEDFTPSTDFNYAVQAALLGIERTE